MKAKTLKIALTMGVTLATVFSLSAIPVKATNPDDEIVNFKDSNLKSAILASPNHFDTNGDGELSIGEMKNISNQKIKIT